VPSVLIADDDDPSVKLARVVLEADDWVVSHMLDLDDALAVIAEARPHLIVTALTPWPHVLSRIPQLAATGIPIVAVTALHDSDVERAALHAGCMALINKPIDVTTFSAQLLAYLGGRR